MAFIIRCDSCSSKFKIVNSIWGKSTKCRSCGEGVIAGPSTFVEAAHSTKEPYVQHVGCPKCEILVPFVRSTCPLCDTVLPGDSIQTSPRIAVADAGIERSKHLSRVFIALICMLVAILALAIPLAAYKRNQRKNLEVQYSEQVKTIRAAITAIPQALAQLKVDQARRMWSEASDTTSHLEFSHPNQFENFSTQLNQLDKDINDAKARFETDSNRKEEDAFARNLETQLALVSKCTDEFKFPEARSNLHKVQTELNEFGEVHRTFLKAHKNQIEDTFEVINTRETTYTKKIRAGWVVFEGQLISKEELARRLAEKKEREEREKREAAERERRRQAAEEAERLRMQREAALIRGRTRIPEAYSKSKDCIRRQLKSPSSARFAGLSDQDVSIEYNPDKDNYVIVAWVEAQNAFGVLLKKNYLCVVHCIDGKTWSCDSATLLGE